MDRALASIDCWYMRAKAKTVATAMTTMTLIRIVKASSLRASKMPWYSCFAFSTEVDVVLSVSLPSLIVSGLQNLSKISKPPPLQLHGSVGDVQKMALGMSLKLPVASLRRQTGAALVSS